MRESKVACCTAHFDLIIVRTSSQAAMFVYSLTDSRCSRCRNGHRTLTEIACSYRATVCNVTHGPAMTTLSVRPSDRLSNAWIVTKTK